MKLILECKFQPKEKPVYSWICSYENNKKRDIEFIRIDHKTFLRELELHGEPRKISSEIYGEVVTFRYEY